jgi:hypothetical protein
VSAGALTWRERLMPRRDLSNRLARRARIRQEYMEVVAVMRSARHCAVIALLSVGMYQLREDWLAEGGELGDLDPELKEK